jgi:hypothetical protein
MSYKHHTKYRFYIHKYPQGSTTFPVIDLEEHFNCYYKSFSGNKPTKAMNVYEEKFAEKSGSNLWVPSVDDIAYDTSDITLTLVWKSNAEYAVLEDEQAFFDYVTAQKIEYHDTFRPDRYWQLCLIDAPEVSDEILHGKQQYRVVKYKFRNFGGKFYPTSQI